MNVSKIAKRGLLYTQTGTPYYASPEVWNDKPYDSKSDIWSLGCVIYEMASLKPPFRAEDMEGLYKTVTKGKFKKLPSHFSVDLNNLVKAMLKVNPLQRPSAEKLLQMPMIAKRLNKNLMLEPEEPIMKADMLKTIRLPNNLHYLTDRLPEANYNPIKTKLSTDFNNGMHKMTMPDLLNGSNKLGEESKSNFLKEIKNPKKAGSKQGKKISKSPGRLGQLKKHERMRRDNHQSLDIKVIRGRNEPSSEHYLKKEHKKIEAQIERYNVILRNQKNRNRKGNQIKRKIDLILGRDNSKAVKSKDKMKIYGRGINYNSVKNVRLKPIVSKKKPLPKIRGSGAKMKKKGVYKLPRLY
jgi:NIMA (never in mitosis gene a)-related kinase